MKLKLYLKAILRKYPLIFSYTCIFYNILMCNNKKIKGKNNYLDYSLSLLKKCNIEINGNNNKVVIKNCRCENLNIRIVGDNHVLQVGEECILKKSNFLLEDNNCKVIIGKNTTTEGAHFIAVEPNSTIEVGEDCMFAHDVELLTTDSHSIIDINTNKRINHSKNIIIGKHVWVCSHSRILKGSNIGDNNIIALGTIVTKSSDNNSIIAGIPGKVVKDNVTWIRERI